ncbi:MAG: hypothetical protein AAGC57_18665 [Pseudomonadota bacterium]
MACKAGAVLRLALLLILTTMAPGWAQDEVRRDLQTPEYLQLPDRFARYPFSARNLPIEQALKLFSKNLRIGLKIADGVEGEIAKPLPVNLSRIEHLEMLALEFDFVWYFDGTILNVSPVGDTETKVMPLVKHDGSVVIESLRELDIYQPKFVHRYGQRSRTLRVTGPTRYVEVVAEAVEAIDKADRTEITPMRGGVVTPLLDDVEPE